MLPLATHSLSLVTESRGSCLSSNAKRIPEEVGWVSPCLVYYGDLTGVRGS